MRRLVALLTVLLFAARLATADQQLRAGLLRYGALVATWPADLYEQAREGIGAVARPQPAATVTMAVEVAENLAYGPSPAQRIDICRAGNDQRDRPAVLLIHGGGWSGGDKRAYRGWCEQLARAGSVAAAINYRLARADQPDTWWPAQLSDVQLALRWLRAHSGEFGFAPARLCASGDSAGGQLAVFLGVHAPVVTDSDAALFAEQSTAVSCVVDNFGPVDLTDAAYLPGAHLAMFGGARRQDAPAAYAAASPLPLVSARSAPMLIVQGYDDRLVPLHQSMQLLAALVAHGVPGQFIGYAGGHEWQGLSPAEKNAIIRAEFAFMRDFADAPPARASSGKP
jgi:acetyl esterase/lipase